MDNLEKDNDATSDQKTNDVIDSIKKLNVSEKSDSSVDCKKNDDQSKSKVKKLQVSRNLLKDLAACGIIPLKKKSLRFPNAAFYCQICDYHCDTAVICKRHITESRHKKTAEISEQKTTISILPLPNSCHVDMITELITDVVKENAMSEDKKIKCIALKQYLEDHIRTFMPGISLVLNGSCLNGFALMSSGLDVNIELGAYCLTKTLGYVFEQIYKIILDHKQFKNESKMFNASSPIIFFTDSAGNIDVSISLNNPVSIYTNEVISHYAALDHRVSILGLAFRYWAKLCEIDKFSEGSLAPRCFPLMVIYFLQRCKEPVLPCLHKDRNNTFYTKPDNLDPKWNSSNKSSVGKLWLELLRFYSICINFKNYLIDISSPHYLSRTTKKNIKIGIEDPLSHKTSTTSKKWMLSQSVTSNDSLNFICDVLRNTFFYFLVPQRPYGPLFCKIKDAKKHEIQFVFKCEVVNSSNIEAINKETKENVSANDTIDSETTEEAKEPEIKISTSSSKYYYNVLWPTYNVEDDEEEFGIENLKTSLDSVEMRFALKALKIVKNEHLTLKFDAIKFTKGEKPPIRCSACHLGGHLKDNCTEFDLPPLCQLPKQYNPKYNIALCKVLLWLKDNFKPKDREIAERKFILEKLQNFIRETYPEGVLELFGSSTNGFGFGDSDLDICLIFEDNPMGKEIDQIQIIKNLAQKFKSDTKREIEVRDILAITTAKVPIVKLYLPTSYLEVDISLYNILALRNTRLLRAYSKIDSRVQILGYALKYLAKQCSIGDASRGSLSSYAYILLIIHYLQNCSPPVLPVLQELFTEETKPKEIIDVWDTWFYDDLDSLSTVWKGHSQNKMSPSELWIGLLTYYAENFDWELNVVTIKQIEPLSRIEKMWNTQCISIEDPFDHNHNLGGGLTRRMSTYIMKCFIRAREVFGATAINCYDPQQIMDYTFDASVLTDGYPPNDRGCRCCGKIGHLVRECPKKRHIEERKRDRRKRDDQRVRNDSIAASSTKKFDLMKMDLPAGSSIPRQSTPLRNDKNGPKTLLENPDARISQSVPVSQIAKSPKNNSYNITEFFELVSKAKQSVPPKESAVQPARDSNKPAILPPPGFVSNISNRSENNFRVGHQLNAVAKAQNVKRFDVNSPVNEVRSQIFYSNGVNNRMRLDILNRPIELHNTALNNYGIHPRPNLSTNCVRSISNPINIQSPVSMPSPQMQMGYLNRPMENSQMRFEFPNSTYQINQQAQYDALNQRSYSDALTRQAQSDALNRPVQVEQWNQVPIDMARHYAIDNNGRPLQMSPYGQSPLPSSFPRTNPNIFATQSVDQTRQQMLMYGSNSFPINAYGVSDVIPNNFGSPLPYQLPISNSQNLPQPSNQQVQKPNSYQ